MRSAMHRSAPQPGTSRRDPPRPRWTACTLAWIAAGILGAAAPAPGSPPAVPAVSPIPASPATISSAIPWLNGLDQALEQAQYFRRPIMIDVWAQWCRWCHELDRRTYSQTPVIERAQAMICAKVNADREPQVGRRYGIRGLPTILFLDRHGQEIDRVTGFVQAEPFAAAMDAVLAAADRLEARVSAHERDPDNPARIYALADELLAQKRWREAEPLLAALTPAGPRAGSTFEADAVLDLGIAREARGDQAAARQIYEGFVTAYPKSPRRGEAELRLGQLLLAAGEAHAARARLEAVVTLTGTGSWKAAEAARLLTAAGSQAK